MILFTLQWGHFTESWWLFINMFQILLKSILNSSIICRQTHFFDVNQFFSLAVVGQLERKSLYCPRTQWMKCNFLTMGEEEKTSERRRKMNEGRAISSYFLPSGSNNFPLLMLSLKCFHVEKSTWRFFLIYWSYCKWFISACYSKEENVCIYNLSSKHHNLLHLWNYVLFLLTSTRTLHFQLLPSDFS